MYVLTEGWYDDIDVKGVTDSESVARDWEESGRTREYCGPFELGAPVE